MYCPLGAYLCEGGSDLPGGGIWSALPLHGGQILQTEDKYRGLPAAAGGCRSLVPRRTATTLLSREPGRPMTTRRSTGSACRTATGPGSSNAGGVHK